jgi:hypothetical protein
VSKLKTVLGAVAAGFVMSLLLVRAGVAHDHPPARTPPPGQAWPPAAVIGNAASSIAMQTPNMTVAPARRTPEAAPGQDSSANDERLCRRAKTTVAGDGAAILAAERRIGSELGGSSDAFAQAVAEWIDEEGSDAPARQDRLARLATSSSDPRVYALAYRECRKSSQEDAAPACQALSARQWAQLDPGNALPWVFELDDATTREDPVARDEALYQIASSARIEERKFAAAGIIAAHAGTDGAGLVAANRLVTQAQHLADTQALPLYSLLKTCLAGSQEAGMVQPCTNIGELLVRRSDSLGLRLVGGAIDFAITDDATRRDRLRDKNSLLGSAAPSREIVGCASLRETLDYQRRAGEVGQVAALRERAGGSAAPRENTSREPRP